MSERLSAVGGRFSVGTTGRDGRGFRLIATVPPPRSAARACLPLRPPERPWTLTCPRDHQRPGRRRAPAHRLLLADDQTLIREALAALLSFEPDMEVVAQVGRGDEVVRAAAEHDVDVALLDIEMPGMDGLARRGPVAPRPARA